MNQQAKQLSINLFLAREMGLTCVEYIPEAESVAYVPKSEVLSEFDPHTDKAQWAEVVLWFTGQNAKLEMDGYEDRVKAHKGPLTGRSEAFEQSTELRMAATLEAIALALGWKEDA